MSNNIRIKTTPGGSDKRLNVKIDQKFDFIEVLSLKISQDEAYRRFCSDYGAIIGRVIVNNGLGVPNARVSIFIPIDEEDALDPEILGLYPYEVVTDKDREGIPYNLMPESVRGKDECYTSIGTFPSKREIQDNPELKEIYCKYYKFTTTTNDSGDFMLFGVPVGNHYLHVDADISDIGIISQRPYDLVSQGVDSKKFYSSSKFKGRTEDPNLTQLKTVSPVSVSVVPFWGDVDECEIGITRADVDLKTTIIPSAIFMGSIFGDSDKNSVNKNCRPRRKLGQGDELVTGSGTIEMIRYNNDGGIENFDIEGGRVIDDNGTWAYQIPMNLDYVITAEDGTLIPSEDTTKGIATRARTRFRISMDETGGEGRLRARAKYLVPHNPDSKDDSDYSFGSTSKDKHFTDLYWNKIYTVKNHISRVQSRSNVELRTFVGIKDVDEGGVNSPFPFNKLDTKTNPLFVVICIIVTIILALICLLNSVIIKIINFIFSAINAVLKIACKVVHGIAKFIAGLIPSRIAGIRIWRTSKKNRFRRNACMGCCTSRSCKTCNCDNIIGLLSYITLPCGEDKYAPCGDGKGWLGRATLKATKFRISEDVEEPQDDPGNCPENPDVDPENFHYAGDPHCHEETKLLGFIEIDDAGFLDCILIQIAEALNVFKFDFYNDWLNGTLYSFLLKYKQKKNSDKYCNNDKGYSNYIVDSCTGARPQGNDSFSKMGLGHGVDTSKSVRLREGYIKKYKGDLYYAAYARTKSYKLFSTDIVSLGSVFDCDWQGIPKIYPWLVETSYNMPPLVGEYGDDNRIDVSGYDSHDCFNTSTGLIGYVNCLGLQTGAKQCNNIRRLSELGMGLDENRLDEMLGGADNAILNNDVENPFVRGAFIYANRQDYYQGLNIPLVYIDGDNNWDYKDLDHERFRNVTERTIWQYENSLYFYFGLNAGRTALNKLINDFFTPCIPEKDKDFYIVVTRVQEDDPGPLPTGEIDIELIGGVGPFTFEWSGPIVDGNPYPQTPTSQNLENLYVGTYNVIVTDFVGNIAEGSVIVPGPPTVACDTQTTDTVTFGGNEGEVLVSFFSGTPPYSVDLYSNLINYDMGNNPIPDDNVDPNSPGVNFISGATGISSASFVFSNLEAGEYFVIVKDSGNPQTQCTDLASVFEPQELKLSISGSPLNCNGSNDGEAYVIVTGGVTPYTYHWPYNNDDSSFIGNLQPGNYQVLVSDFAGHSGNTSYTVVEPTLIEYSIVTENITYLIEDDYTDPNGYNSTDGIGTTDGKISINIIGAGGTPPYTIEVEGGYEDPVTGDEFYTIITGNTLVLENMPYGDERNGNEYEVTIRDSASCRIIDLANVFRPEERIKTTLKSSTYFGNMVRLYTEDTYGGFADTNDPNIDDTNISTAGYIRQFQWSNDLTEDWVNIGNPTTNNDITFNIDTIANDFIDGYVDTSDLSIAEIAALIANIEWSFRVIIKDAHVGDATARQSEWYEDASNIITI